VSNEEFLHKIVESIGLFITRHNFIYWTFFNFQVGVSLETFRIDPLHLEVIRYSLGTYSLI